MQWCENLLLATAMYASKISWSLLAARSVVYRRMSRDYVNEIWQYDVLIKNIIWEENNMQNLGNL